MLRWGEELRQRCLLQPVYVIHYIPRVGVPYLKKLARRA